MDKKRILMNTQPHKVAGIARVVQNIVTDRQFRNTYEFCTIDTENPSHTATMRSYDTDYGKHIVGGVGRKNLDWCYGKGLKELQQYMNYYIDVYKRIIEKEKPHLIIIHGTYIVPRCLLKAAESFDIPTIIYYHGVYAKEVQFSDNAIQDLATKIEADFLSKNYSYIFPSAHTKSTVEQEYNFLFGDNAVIIPNGVPDYFFRYPIRRKSNDRKPQIGFCMSWSMIKNKQFVIRFAEQNTLRGYPVDIHLVTRCKEGERVELDGVKVHESVVHKYIPSLFRSRDALFCPSHFETYGNVAQESLACGVHAFVHKEMGVREVFEKIGLDDHVVDFSSRDFDYFLGLLQKAKSHSLTNQTIDELYDHIVLYKVNSQRKDFFSAMMN